MIKIVNMLHALYSGRTVVLFVKVLHQISLHNLSGLVHVVQDHYCVQLYTLLLHLILYITTITKLIMMIF